MQSYTTQSLFSVKGKTVIVTGGGSGVGKGMATAFAVNGAKVIICGRRMDTLQTTADELNAAAKESGNGGTVVFIQADVATKQGVIDFYNKASEHMDQLDVLINNAGYSSGWKDNSSLADAETLETKLWSIDDSDWANMTAIHVAGPYYLAIRAIPFFKKSQDPVVINITSLAAIFLNRAVCEYSYAQSKAAEAHLTRLMAAALGPLGIRVNSICPGLFPSQLTTDANGEFWAPMQDAIKNIPKGRAGKWEELAGPALMLASPAGAYLNGSEIVCDGGWVLNSSARDV
ncbi:uncharacterized protein MKK02DRAFT_35820 [Dioszegia hungarica]|uniref:NAD(P)-binding protein n=1 Tax=Dioszegia hungarica TaxID=4972 RepID=A0AA38HH55_9TREE|nr:uncharacterized protein MKK02DRAFT_35820 [Dioszegia hungarica]KAI9638934.1 hypothetical protein MKK02DRAFT_35820 [Dioszegia hungarica]